MGKSNKTNEVRPESFEQAVKRARCYLGVEAPLEDFCPSQETCDECLLKSVMAMQMYYDRDTRNPSFAYSLKSAQDDCKMLANAREYDRGYQDGKRARSADEWRLSNDRREAASRLKEWQPDEDGQPHRELWEAVMGQYLPAVPTQGDAVLDTMLRDQLVYLLGDGVPMRDTAPDKTNEERLCMEVSPDAGDRGRTGADGRHDNSNSVRACGACGSGGRHIPQEVSELEAMADRLRKVKPDGRDGSHAMLASVAYAVMGGRPGPWSADRCSRLRDTLARLADELARRLRDAEDGPWERAVTAAENVNLRARVAELEDQLEESHAKRRALKAHISKMQSGRHGWHLAYMALVDCLRKHGVEVENDGDRISVEYRREDELCAVVDSMGDVIKRLNAEIARMKGDGHDEG